MIPCVMTLMEAAVGRTMVAVEETGNLGNVKDLLTGSAVLRTRRIIMDT